MSSGANTLWKLRFAVLLIAAVAIFVVSQVLISAHTAKYGAGPHDHGGQVCVLSLAAPGGDKLIASAAFVVAVTFSFWCATAQLAQTVRRPILVRAASPRGPPNR